MQTDKTAVLEKLKQRINNMISMYETVVYERNELVEKYNNAQEIIIKLNSKVQLLEDKLKTKELADAFSEISQDHRAAKERIDTVIKEIDRCLELLTI